MCRANGARGLMMLGLQGLCIGNGIITVENREQAEERADAKRLDTAGGAAPRPCIPWRCAVGLSKGPDGVQTCN